MPSNHYLISRKGVWYFQRRVPNEAQGHIGKAVIKESLGTTDLTTARALRDQKNAAWSARFQQAKKASCSEKTTATMLPREELMRRIRTFVKKKDNEYELQSLDLDLTEEARRELYMDAVNEREELKNGSSIVTEIRVDRAATEILGVNGSPDLEELSWSQCLGLIRDGLIEIAERDIARLGRTQHQTHYDHRFAPEAPASAPTPPLTSPNGKTFKQLADEYLSQYQAEADSQGRTAKTVDKVKSHARLLIELTGKDTQVSAVTFDVARAVRDRLNRVPTNMAKRYKGKTLEEAGELEAKGEGNFLAHNTQEAILRTFGSIIGLAMAKGLMTSNPVATLKPLAKKKSAKEARHPFTTAELNKLFEAPLYTGCQNDAHGFAKPGTHIIRGTRFWVPLVALWSGMRANEICQLRCEDVQKLDGLWTISVTDAGQDQMIKSEASRRVFPIHPALNQIGFIDFVEKQKSSANARLFPDLKPDRYNYHSTKLTRWFDGSFMPKYIDKVPGKSFHSFRHNYRDALRRIEAPEATLRALCGWTESNSTSSNYGSGYAPKQLMDWVEKIAYPDLNLKHLYVKQPSSVQ